MWISQLHPVLLGVLQIAALGLPACALAWLLRRAAIPGGAPAAAIVGGIVAGLLIGATVGGRVMPEAHDRLFVGGVDESIAMAEMQSAHNRQHMALQATGVSLEAMPELAEHQRVEIEDAKEKIDSAREQHAKVREFAASFVFAALMAVGLAVATPWNVGRRWHRKRSGAALIGIALGAAMVIVLALWIGVQWKTAVALALVTTLPGLSRRLLRQSAGVLGAIACVVVISGLQRDEWGWIVLAGALAGYLLGGRGARSDERGRALGRAMLNPVVLPVCVALLASVIDLPELVNHGQFWWLLLLGVVASSDLRWVCYYAAIRGTSRAWWGAAPWSMASRWMRDGAAIVQVLLTFLVFGLEQNLGDVIAASLAGAAVIELTRNVRSRLAAALDRGWFRPLDQDHGPVS